MAKVAVETEGAITIVSIDRFAEARTRRRSGNREPAARWLLAFDRDESQSGRDPAGRGGTFCAGYDLKAVCVAHRPPDLRSREARPDGPDAAPAHKR